MILSLSINFWHLKNLGMFITYLVQWFVYFRNVLYRSKSRQSCRCASRLLQLQFRRSDVSFSTPVTGTAQPSPLSGLIFDPERLLGSFVPRVCRKLIRIPVLQVPVKAWLKDSQEDSFTWLSRTEQGFQVCCAQS